MCRTRKINKIFIGIHLVKVKYHVIKIRFANSNFRSTYDSEILIRQLQSILQKKDITPAATINAAHLRDLKVGLSLSNFAPYIKKVSSYFCQAVCPPLLFGYRANSTFQRF